MMKQGVANELIVAHRGYASKHPENSLEALNAAVAAGVSLLEIDVQLTSDLVPIMLHDSDLKRTEGLDICALTSTAAGLTSAAKNISTLEEVVVWLKVNPTAKLFVELKQESIDAHGLEVCVRKTAEACSEAISQCVFISFNYDAVELASRQFEEYGWVLSDYSRVALDRAHNLSPHYVFIDTSLISTNLESSPWKWVAYEVATRQMAADLAELGVDLFETKSIDTLNTFDYVIVGGGIHGVGVAQAAAAAGYSVLLIEKTSLAHGTSSKSSKLIHGGLRYLESAQLKLVHECLSERAKLIELAPELVRLESFYIPVYKGTRRPPWLIHLGLILYSILGGLKKSNRFKRLKKSNWAKLEGLNTQNLRAVFKYYDGATNDKKLTEAVMDSAQKLGAVLAMPAEFINAEAQPDLNKVIFVSEGQTKTVNARLLVNASGPWANILLENITPTGSKLDFDLIGGTHIIVERPQKEGFYYVESKKDGRAVFIMPWYGKMMIGTTEVEYNGDPSSYQPTQEEVVYLIDVANEYFPELKLTSSDVREKFAGLRVLPNSQSKAFSRPRETTFHRDANNTPRVVTIYGGKLTAYRTTAQDFIKKHAHLLPKRKKIADTGSIKL